jgi:exopolysaccharide biosynthesis WecB/TagA/CpsF family protein
MRWTMTNRFLVIQLADIGDLILSTPALSALREARPAAHIAVLTTAHAAPILHDSGLADDIITFDKHTFDSLAALLKPRNLLRLAQLLARLRRGRYDTILILHHFSTRLGALKFAALVWGAGSPRVVGLDNGNGFFLTHRLPDEGFGAHHQAQYWLNLAALVGANAAPRIAKIGISAADQAWADATLNHNDAKTWIAIHAGSGGYSTARRWDAGKFAAVADQLSQRHDAQIVLVGGKGDDSAAVIAAMTQPALDLTGQTTLGQLAALLGRCALFIGADSGVMHLAAAVDTPTVAIFGPSNHEAWSPWQPDGHCIVVRSAPECSPCSYVGTGVGLRGGCAARTCMKMVTVEQVVQAVGQILVSEDSGRPIGRPYPSPTPVVGTTYRSSAAQKQHSSRLHILNLPIDAITYDGWIARIDEWMRTDRCHHVCTTNPEMMMIAQGDPNFRNILQRADLCVPDGVGLLWAARRRGYPLPQRVTGSDGVPIIAAAAAVRGWRVFLLGAANGVAAQSAAVLRQQHPSLNIVGTHSGSPAADEEDALVERINASGADILFVAYGAPEQDKWIARNLPRLHAKMAMGVGGTFDFIAGIVPRAPLWMQRLGIEWLYRLYLQPRRIGRMLRLPRFVIAVLLEKKRI